MNKKVYLGFGRQEFSICVWIPYPYFFYEKIARLINYESSFKHLANSWTSKELNMYNFKKQGGEGGVQMRI